MGMSAPPIVVGFDPQTRDRAPVLFGIAAARFTGAPLIVVAACAHGEPAGHAEDLAPEAKEALAELEAGLDVPVQLREVAATSAPRALHESAEAEGAALVVVGSSDRGAVGRVLPGSTAERVIHAAPCPVAVVPNGWEQRGGLDPIGVAYTQTDEAREALRAGLALARKAGATLRVVTVVQPGAGIFAPTEATRPDRLDRTDVDDVEGLHKVAAERAARAELSRLGADDVQVEIDAFVEEPADALVRASEHLDLLICGSRGYGPLRWVLLGGVSRRVVAEAHCPVIVLPRGVHAPLEALAAAPGTVGAP